MLGTKLITKLRDEEKTSTRIVLHSPRLQTHQEKAHNVLKIAEQQGLDEASISSQLLQVPAILIVPDRIPGLAHKEDVAVVVRDGEPAVVVDAKVADRSKLGDQVHRKGMPLVMPLKILNDLQDSPRPLDGRALVGIQPPLFALRADEDCVLESAIHHVEEPDGRSLLRGLPFCLAAARQCSIATTRSSTEATTAAR